MKIIRIRPYAHNSFCDVILTKWGDQYVTWISNTQDGGRYWGHYFSNLKDALADWESR